MSVAGVSVDIARDLRSICGDEHVVVHEPRQSSDDDTVDLSALSVGANAEPTIAVSPGSPEEVTAILRLANERAFGVLPCGMLRDWMPQFGVQVLLSTMRLCAVEHYDHADLTVGVGAGTTVSQLNAMVGADRLLFAVDPALPERATIGAVLATATHGPLRHGYGAVRDFCIGIRFVTGDGRRAKGGGRVVKNVAGYDLMKLLIGSYGTLAVITSASFKLFPAPRQTRTFLAEFATWQEALKFRDLILRSPLAPMCLELVSPGARRMMRPEMTEDAWVICVRGAGNDAVLARYRKELGSAVRREVEGVEESRLWRVIENFPVGDDSDAGLDMLRLMPGVIVNVAPGEVAQVLSAASDFADQNPSLSVAMIGRAGVGHLLLTLWASDADIAIPYDEFSVVLLKNLPRGGSLTVSTSPNPFLATPTHLPSMRAVKQALDPNNVLRGRQLF